MRDAIVGGESGGRPLVVSARVNRGAMDVSAVRNAIALVRAPLPFVLGFTDGPPVTRIRAGTSSMYVVNDPGLLQAVLATDEHRFVMGKLITRARASFGEGLGMNVMTPRGLRLHEPRLAQRRAIQPAFRREHQLFYQQVIARTIADRLAGWESGGVVDLCVEGRGIGFRAAIRALLGQSGPAEDEIVSAMEDLLGDVVRYTLTPRWLTALPMRWSRRYRATLSRLDELLSDRASNGSSPLLSALRAARDAKGEPLTREQVRDHLLTIVGAGTETVSDTIPWLFHELHRNPAVADRVRAEVRAALADRPLEALDIRAMEYCLRVVHETLRLHSPQWLLSRRTIEQVRLGTTVVPAGATVVYSLYALHRDPRFYPEPERFDPDRWTPPARAALPRCAFIPFSTGSGRCIGDGFALTELVMVLAALADRWRLVPTAGPPPREVVGLTVRPDRMPMVCSLATMEKVVR
ncbi:cytochrome P450 [Amycolatopsis sp. cg5]|uniref:cytochrome P450 n=1 Tax=Amycolatopsis sp. cg5 TaxID=3238802 RepID=UPI0035269927